MRLEDLNPRPWQDLRDEAVQADVEAKRVKAKGMTKNQSKYLNAIETSTVTICLGPAGTGKTYLACGRAAEMLRQGKVERIVITRPLVECDEEVGILPGDLSEKVGPFIQPMMDAFGDFLFPREIKDFIKEGKLLVVPLALMRGRTFKNAFVILDEAQNATFGQLRMFLTRFGLNSKVVINGDHTQSDLRDNHVPLIEVVRKLARQPDIKYQPISIVRMYAEDIVRHAFIRWIDEALTGEKPKQEGRQVESSRSIDCPRYGDKI